jgi:hypothetical protein
MRSAAGGRAARGPQCDGCNGPILLPNCLEKTQEQHTLGAGGDYGASAAPAEDIALQQLVAALSDLTCGCTPVLMRKLFKPSYLDHWFWPSISVNRARLSMVELVEYDAYKAL